jgi:hypothetical protein
MRMLNYSSLFSYSSDNHFKEEEIMLHPYYYSNLSAILPVTVAERSETFTVFTRFEAGTVGLNPTQGMDVSCWCMCARFSVCDELITRPRSPTDCP